MNIAFDDALNKGNGVDYGTVVGLEIPGKVFTRIVRGTTWPNRRSSLTGRCKPTHAWRQELAGGSHGVAPTSAAATAVMATCASVDAMVATAVVAAAARALRARGSNRHPGTPSAAEATTSRCAMVD